MSHILALFFAFVLSFGHVQAADTQPPTDFVQTPDGLVSTYGEIVSTPDRTSNARRIAFNSYSEDACRSCLSTNSTSQPHLVWRAPR